MEKASRRVFVVDDQPDAAESLARLLEHMGHEVRFTTDARQALKLAQAFVPDIALVDIGMPHVDGCELAMAMRSTPELADIRLVAVTAYGQPKDRALTRKAGFDAHIQKPMAIDLLESILKQFPGRS